MSAPIQGLRVSNKFADSQNPIEILRNLNLDIEDLDRIRSVSNDGVRQSDIRTLSGLTIDLEKEAIAIFNETRSYENVLSILNDGRRRIAGNINVSGSIVAPTFKFRTVDFSANNEIRTVDFSTSRSSAWSSFGDPSDSVFYGGDVILSGNNSTIEISSIEFVEQPKEKRFASQIPTHKFRINIDGENYDVYAMKGIPLKFKGFFRSVRNLNVEFNILENIRPSWIIRNRNGQEFVYQNRSSGDAAVRQSTISFFDSRAEEREIEFYYPVNRIRRIRLNDARIFEIPNVSIPTLLTLEIVNGDLIEMPNIANLYPAITAINLSGNDLTRSNDSTLRTFSPEVVNRLKNANNTLTSLTLDGVYSNQCTADLSELTNLITFRADSSGTNARRMTGTSPAIGPSVQTYHINGNRFTSLSNTVVQSETLKVLNIRSNGITGLIDTSGDNLKQIQRFISGGNGHQIVDMSNKSDLIEYACTNQNFPAAARTGTTVFENCPSLEIIRINNTNVIGALPNFSSNAKLREFFSWATGWSDATSNNSIAENTFGPTEGGCRATLENFNLQSGNLLAPIHPNAFRGMSSLRNLVVRSYGRGITGPFPSSISECTNLTALQLDTNRMTGTIPNFVTNQRLITLILSQNQFSGIVPLLSLPNLRTLFLQNNQFTSFVGINCPNLTQFNASFNNIDTFPNLDNAFRLQNILMSNNANMRYVSGTLENLTAIRRLEIANCSLARSSVDAVLTDLNENYNRNPRRNVLVNLLGNASPSASERIINIINRLRQEGWTLGLET
jgi:Leucine-rich repeat (LRR) protein